MGLLRWIKEGKKENEPADKTLEADQIAIGQADVIEEADSLESSAGGEKHIEDSYDIIAEAARQLEEAKVEYQAVTSYLTDIQIIDSMPIDERGILNDAARKIVTLTRDRSGYQNREDIKISEVQYRHMEQFEEEIPEQIDKIKKNEEYLITVKNDLRALEGEKGSLQFKKEKILKEQQYLKGTSILISILTAGLFVLFAGISSGYHKDMSIPYLLTILLAVISAVYVFYAARKNIYDMKLTEKKMNRAISLLNKVKIKYVNTANLIDYSYNKYRVNSSNELRYLWEQYVKAKDEEKRYMNNTESLNYYNEILVKQLRKFKLGDPDIWIYQAIAIIDNKEMVEVRHRLNIRRGKLRERIDYNTKLKEEEMEKVKELVK